MTYKREDEGDETVLKIEGTLDAVTAPELKTVMDGLVSEQRKTVTLDLSLLRIIDSSGVAVIVNLAKRIRANPDGQVNRGASGPTEGDLPVAAAGSRVPDIDRERRPVRSGAGSGSAFGPPSSHRRDPGPPGLVSAII
jgi:anti-sigma B factor antagonist